MFAAGRIARKRVNQQTITAFETALRNADSLRLIRPDKNLMLFKSSDSNVIRGLADNIKLSRFGAEHYCACGGDAKFEFYKEGHLALDFTFHHKYKIRWRGFHKDIKLTKESAAYLVNWLLQNVKDEKFLKDFSFIASED
jgi:hypothetical protein